MTKTQFFVLISIFSAFAVCLLGISAGSVVAVWMITWRPESALGVKNGEGLTPVAVADATGEHPAAYPLTTVVIPTFSPVPEVVESQSLPTALSDPRAALRHSIEETLGKGNRGVPRITEVNFNDPEPKAIIVRWAINDSLTEGFIISGAQHDATNILKAIDDSGIDYSYVILSGSFPLVDTYGKTEEKNVVNLTFNKSTTERIEWEGFNSDNIYYIADEAYVHTLFHGDWNPTPRPPVSPASGSASPSLACTNKSLVNNQDEMIFLVLAGHMISTGPGLMRAKESNGFVLCRKREIPDGEGQSNNPKIIMRNICLKTKIL